MATAEERALHAERQRNRRLSLRACGHCGQAADMMLDWSGRKVPVCQRCWGRLDGDSFAWRKLQDEGLRCDVGDVRPCDDCIVLQLDARLIPSEEVDIVAWEPEEAYIHRPSRLGRLIGALGRALGLKR